MDQRLMQFRIGRTIVAVLVALAVATLPAAVGFAAGATTVIEMSASQPMPDCDHRHYNAPSGNTQKDTDDGACPLACALAGFGLAAADVSGVAYSASAGAALKLVRVRTAISSLMGSPPFRPPRA